MKGQAVYLYAFDVANEIATERIREILCAKPFPFEIRMGKTIPKDVPLYRPLTIALPPREADSNVGRVTLKPFVKIFDLGVVSVSIEIPFDRPATDLVPFHHVTLSDGRTLDKLAGEIRAQVVQSIRPALLRPTEPGAAPEAYTVFCVADPDGAPDVPQWVRARRRDIAALLMEETDAALLSDAQVDEVMDHTLSYTVHDSVVIDWDAALVLDRDAYYDDVLYVLELANLQLEEFQYIDGTLDALLNRAYDDLDRYFGRTNVFGIPEKTLSSLRRMQMDLTKMSDEATNIAKFSGDWYLARVYLACHERFHIDGWRAGVRDKLASLDHLYTLAQTDINNRRMVLMEGLIIVLFIIDLLALVLAKK